MHRSTLLGFGVGVTVGVGVTLALLRSCHTPSGAPAIDRQPQNISERRRSEDSAEVTSLRRRVAELESRIAPEESQKPGEAAAFGMGSEPSSTAESVPSDYYSPEKVFERYSQLAKKGHKALRDPYLATLAAEIERAGPKTLEAVCERLRTADSASERMVTAALLGKVGTKEVIPQLAHALRPDEDVVVRRTASDALSHLGWDGVEAALRPAMQGDTDWEVRLNSAYGLAIRKIEDGVQVLVGMYDSPSATATNRQAVMSALGKVCAPSTAPFFRQFLGTSTEVSTLMSAIDALQRMKDKASLVELRRVAGDGSLPATVREAAQNAANAISQ